MTMPAASGFENVTLVDNSLLVTSEPTTKKKKKKKNNMFLKAQKNYMGQMIPLGPSGSRTIQCECSQLILSGLWARQCSLALLYLWVQTDQRNSH